MEFIDITEQNKNEYNAIITHPLQSYEWGEFRKKTGVKVIRRGLLNKAKMVDGFTLTIHKIPKTNFTIGYLPKGKMPASETLEELKRIGEEEKCIFIQLEPNILKDLISKTQHPNLRSSFHPLFTKYTFILDLSKSEEELLKSFHPKTRYNIKIAQKNNVKIEETNSSEAFKKYLRLTDATTTRQHFFAHTPSYHTKMWETLRDDQGVDTRGQNLNKLTAHLFSVTYKPENEKEQTLVSWILFVFHDTLYYPYGASSTKFRNVMASNLMMWEAIKFGKKLGLKKFDMWGALGENPDKNDSWYGFHKFKQGYGTTLTEFVGSYDLVINPMMYNFYKLADKARWGYLRIKKRIGL